LGNEQRTDNRRESLEKTIAKILHRYCNFGWANYYIPGEKFPSLIEELVEVASPAGQAARQDTPRFADSAGAMRFFVEELDIA